jgi:hypothetical protein
MLYGKLAFEANSTRSWYNVQLNEQPQLPQLPEAKAQATVDLLELLSECSLRAMDKNPTKRYKSARDMAAALKNAISGKPKQGLLKRLFGA